MPETYTNKEAAVFINQMMNAVKKGKLDFDNVPIIGEIVDKAVETKMNYVYKTFEKLIDKTAIPSKEQTKLEISKRVDAQADAVFDLYWQKYTEKNNQKLEELNKKISSLNAQTTAIQNDINNLNKTKPFKLAITAITLIVAIIMSLSLIVIFCSLLTHWLAIPVIWSFFGPDFSGVGLFKAIFAILTIGFIYALSFYVIISPTLLFKKAYKKIKKDTEANEEIRKQIKDTMNKQSMNLMSRYKK